MIYLRNDTLEPIFHAMTMTGFPVGELVDCSDWPYHHVDDQLVGLITAGSLVFNDGTLDRTPKTGVSLLRNVVKSYSCAVDKNATDQDISGSGWTHIDHNRVIWDLSSNFDVETGEFVAPFDGVFSHDAGIRAINLVDVARITIALFKGTDLWFVIEEKNVPAGVTEIYLSNSVHFDMYEDERFDLRIILTPIVDGSPTATIDGDDDFTAWGFDLSNVF